MVYEIGDLALESLFGPVAAATASLARLDERLARSPVRDGFLERQSFADATAALWLEGELVHLEDLVLHDAHMDVRTPTHELTRAHAVLRARRQIFSNKPEWALGREGLRVLTRRGPAVEETRTAGEGHGVARLAERSDASVDVNEVDALADEFAAIDAMLERTARLLDGNDVAPGKPVVPAGEKPALIYDLDWNEDERLAEWQDVVAASKTLPAVLRAAILMEAWISIEVLQHAAWLGPLLVAALLRQEGFGPHLLASLHTGAKAIPRERRRARRQDERVLAFVDAIHEAALAGLREHDRLILAKSQLERRLTKRRTSSRLPRLIELVLSRPIISTGIIEQELRVTKQGALNLIAELKLREVTGRGRFRAWGVI